MEDWGGLKKENEKKSMGEKANEEKEETQVTACSLFLFKNQPITKCHIFFILLYIVHLILAPNYAPITI